MSEAIEAPQHWLYPINAGSRYRLGSHDSGELDLVTRQNLWEGILTSPTGLDDWHLSTGYRSMMPGDLIWIVDTAEPKAVVAVGQAVAIYRTPGDTWSVDLMWLRDLVLRLKAHPIPKSSYAQTAQTVSRANARTTEVLETWLQDATSSRRGTLGPAPAEGERRRVLREIADRRGQGAFRSGLLEIYGWRCAISGSECLEVLEAAHIVPYAAGGATDWRNGIILRSDLHTLFDLRLITVDSSGVIHVSHSIESFEYRRYHGRQAALPKTPGLRPTKSALRAHAASLRQRDS